MKPLIVLDRDGVINVDRDDYIRNLEQWIPIPGSIEAIAKLSRKGWQIYIATNQSGIGRGFYSEAVLRAIHERLRTLVHEHGGFIEGIVWCPHTPEANCHCRKPQTGLLTIIQAMSGQALAGHPLVGDSLRDLQTATAKGMLPFLVQTGKGQLTEKALQQPENQALGPVSVWPDLAAVADYLLQS